MNPSNRDPEPRPDGELPLPAVSANTLARCLGVTPKIVYDLAKAGIIERGRGRLYPLEDSIRRYCDHIRQQLSERLADTQPGSGDRTGRGTE